MRLPGRVAAAISIMNDILKQHRPASDVLRDWGKAHRFAGSTDRHVIGTLVYDVLRNRSSAAARMGAEQARALILGVLRDEWQLSLDALQELTSPPHGIEPLTPSEIKRLEASLPLDLPAPIVGNFPAWLLPSFTRVFGKNAALEGQALAKRAPFDMRANSLKTDRTQLLDALARFEPSIGPFSPLCVRIKPPNISQRNINLEADVTHGQGWFEVQDEASQIVALLCGAQPGELVVDVCAGAGGKSLALAAAMQNQGQLFAYDQDKFRLRPIFERMQRAGVQNIEVVAAHDYQRLEAVGGFDCVVVDAPCSGTGAWRRKPDAKWRLTASLLAQRLKDQKEILQKSAKLVKPGGRLIYITCSVLPEENTDQVKDFLISHEDFKILPYKNQWQKLLPLPYPRSADGAEDTLLLTPHQHGTDGFFIALLEKNPESCGIIE